MTEIPKSALLPLAAGAVFAGLGGLLLQKIKADRRGTITNPVDVHPAWARCFNAGDLDGMMSFVEPGGVFVPSPGVALTGAENTAAQQQFLAMGLPIYLDVRDVYVHGDVALAIVDWSITGDAKDGSKVDLKGSSADVLRRGKDGWKLAIDNPFGTARADY
jgi:ketosteroid isomerase-like protein